MAKREKLVVIDGHALIHRAYHAIPPLTTKKGEVVNAVYGFSMILLNVLRDLKPKYIAVAFDLPGKTKRHEAYEQYKAHRKVAPEDLKDQIKRVREVIDAFSIPLYSKEGYEADDVIGTIAKKVPDDIESIIVTGDLDELQLVNEKTKVYTMRRGFTDTVIYDEAAVKDKYSLTPAQFVDYKALRGDPSDNIPGVAGIGEKIASDLIKKYGSLENIYQNLGEIKPAVAEKLRADKENALLSKKLSQLELNLPIKLDLAKCIVHDFDKAKVFSLFQELGFKSLLSRLPQKEAQASIFEEPEKITKDGTRKHIHHAKYHLVTNEEELDSLCSKLQAQSQFAFDTETDSLNEIDANLVGMSFSFAKGEAYYIPVGHKEGKQLYKERVLRSLRPVLENKKIGKIGHNIKYDYIILKKYGITISPINFDTMIAAYLINPVARALKLDELAFAELGLEMVKISELIGSGKDEITFDGVEIEKAKVYACEDADVTWRLFEHLARDLKKSDMLELMADIEAPLIPVLGEMELAGISLDSKKLVKISTDFAKRIKTLETDIYKKAGTKFNIASPIQLGEVLFTKLKLDEKIEDKRELKKLKSGSYSTSASELEKLRGIHPIIDMISKFRELSKLKNTYVDVLPTLVNKNTSRVHTSFNQAITQTGRLSSSDPNLQNIPIRTEEGKKIREAFVADKGNVLLSADYSQIELRVIAHIAKDKDMIETFKEGRDIHTETAAKVYNVPENKVTSEMRRTAKVVNFGILYGVSAHGLKQQLGISREEGQSLIDKYFALHKTVDKYMEKMIIQAWELGYVETIFGRRRYFPEIKSKNFSVRESAKRMAINMPIQGTAADLMKLAMIDIAKELPRISKDSRMLLQVHDELVFEVPEKDAKKVAEFVQDKMENVVKLSVPIEVSIGWGKNWGEAKD